MTLRLAFMGTPDFAVPTLADLIDRGDEIAAIYSQPARPKGRGFRTGPSPVARFGEMHKLPLRTPASLKNPDEQAAFAELALDAAVVVAYGLLLPKVILDAPRLGCFNLHASLLPRWRGAAPIQRAIMAGDAESGVMVMRMDEGLDTGPVLMTQRVAVGRKTHGELHDELARLGAGLMAQAMEALERGQIDVRPQAPDGATYAKKIANEEMRLDWKKPAHEVDCLIRALSPRPGAWCEAKSERLRVLYASPADGAGLPGEVLDDRLTVACGTGALRLMRLQRAGRVPMQAAEFLRGFKLQRGDFL